MLPRKTSLREEFSRMTAIGRSNKSILEFRRLERKKDREFFGRFEKRAMSPSLIICRRTKFSSPGQKDIFC